MPATRFFIFLIFAIFAFSSSLAAQEKPKRDSIYDKIETFSKKRKASKFLYRLLFRNISDAAIIPDTEIHADHTGKHIRNIYITTFDPLGYNSKMEKREERPLENFGNKLHVKSKNFTVRGYLLFKKGDPYNEQKLYESERILRDTKFINRVNVKAIDSTATADSVDIAVRVLDSWSLLPAGGFSGKKFGVGLTESNFLGFGHELSFLYRNDFKNKQALTRGSYTVNNIYGTYINATVFGENDFDNNENVYVNFYRDFVSPLTKWAGGARVDYIKRITVIPNAFNEDPELYPRALVKAHDQDFWAGYQIPLKKKGSGQITDNVAAAVRFQNFVFTKAPDEILDPGGVMKSYQLYLGSVGFTQRKFDVRKNIFNYEQPEDIPYGAMFSATGGVVRQRDKAAMPYLGAAAGFGKFTSMGYFNYKVQYGTLFFDDKNYRSTFRLDGTFFSPLRHYEAFNVRHFLSETLVLGNGRSQSYIDRLNLAEQDEFPEYSRDFIGKDKFVLRYQVQFFIKKPWKNFQLNPYANASFGWLSTDERSLFSGQTHMKFGLGILLYNPYLAFNRFQLSFAYYPKIPFETGSGFDFNGYRNYYIPINPFTIGEPSMVPYSKNPFFEN